MRKNKIKGENVAEAFWKRVDYFSQSNNNSGEIAANQKLHECWKQCQQQPQQQQQSQQQQQHKHKESTAITNQKPALCGWPELTVAGWSRV